MTQIKFESSSFTPHLLPKSALPRLGDDGRSLDHVATIAIDTDASNVDLLTISRLLGHASFATTMIYLHCRREHLHSAPSPLDWLPVKQLPTYQPPAESGQPPQSNQSPPEDQQPPS